MYDVKITNGTVVDGTGAPRFVGDVAVKDGVVVEVSQSSLDGDAAETVDATGLLVTPGFVDIHTHYDGQATWDPLLEPSSGHGVTTVVAGNCGVGFAPVRPGDEEWLIKLMEGVEDIPGTALTEGIDWSWETFPEYLDALDGRQFGIDVGVQVSHGAVRAYAMGERGAGQRARHARRDRGHGGDRAGSGRGRRARLLDVAHARPPRHGRPSGTGHLRGRGRAVRARPRDAARRTRGVRARAAGRVG